MKYLAIDNGGTFIKYGVLDENGKILYRGKTETPGFTAKLNDYLEKLDKIVEECGNDIEAIVFSTPGNIDRKSGGLRTAGALVYLANQNLKQIVKERYGKDCSVVSDGHASVLAEKWKGSLQEAANCMTIVLGTGIGGGIVLNGDVYAGSNNSSGAISMMITNPVDEFKMQNMFVASGSTTALVYGVAAASGTDPQTLDGEKVFAMVDEGNPAAAAIMDRFADGIAKQMFTLQAVLDLDAFAISGGVSQREDLVEAIRSHFNAIFENPEFAMFGGCPLNKARVYTCAFNNDANLIGALYNHFLLAKEA